MPTVYEFMLNGKMVRVKSTPSNIAKIIRMINQGKLKTKDLNVRVIPVSRLQRFMKSM